MRYRIVKYNNQFAIQAKCLGLFWMYSGEYGIDKYRTVEDAERVIKTWRQDEKPPYVEIVKEM